MAVQFKVPASPARSTLTIDTFLGADFTNDPANVDIDKSPDLLNMIRDVPGKVRKCLGWKSVALLPDAINGYHTMRGQAYGLLHHGNVLMTADYEHPVELYSDANNARSRSWQFSSTRKEETKSATITDGVANFATNSSETINKLVAKVNLVQDLHGYDRPWPEGGGKNKFDYDSWKGVSVTRGSAVFENNGVTLTATSNDCYTASSSSAYPTLARIPVSEGETITLSWESDSVASVNNGRCFIFPNGETSGSVSTLAEYGSLSYTVPSGVTFVTFRVGVGASGATIHYRNIMVRKSGDDTFEPYSNICPISGNTQTDIVLKDADNVTRKTVTVSFGQTVYGGSVDAATGLMTVDKKIADLGSFTYTYDSTNRRFQTLVSEMKSGTARTVPMTCSCYEVIDDGRSIAYVPDSSIYSGNQRLYIHDSRYTNASAFQTAVSGLMVVYPLASPFTVQLTPQQIKSLAGVNNISASTGDILECTFTQMASKGRVCILDGKALLLWDGDTVKKATEEATVPVVTIGGIPSGGGTSYYPLNLLSAGFTEQFLGTADDTDYHLSFTDLDNTEVKAEVLQNDGTWSELVEGTGFSVDRATGVVSFIDPPGESPVTGEDNVKITAYKTNKEYTDRINKCTIGVLYGASGDLNRLFVSGNPEVTYANYQWYSEAKDPTYFPDTNYQLIGTEKSAIVGYSIIGPYLAVFKDELEVKQNIVLVHSITVEDKTTFATYSTIHGTSAISPDSFQVLAGEPLFLTRLGVYALTSQDVTAKELTNLRSFYLNGKLLDEPNLDNAYAFIYKDFYILAVNGRLYILDGLQPIQTDKSAPYSTRQFVGFYRDNVDANVMWEEDGALWFGTTTGKVCRFYTDPDVVSNYNDDGVRIHARWETPDFDGKLFYKNKTFRYLAVRLKRAIATSVLLSAMKRGLWTMLTLFPLQARYLSFKNITFSKFSFSSDMTSRTLSLKIRIKKVDKARFRFENKVVNESFALDKIGLEFVEKGNFKS